MDPLTERGDGSVTFLAISGGLALKLIMVLFLIGFAVFVTLDAKRRV